MSYINFCNQIRSAVQSTVGTDYKVSLVKNEKLNGVTLQSIVILKNNESISPNIYLEDYYSGYTEGRSIESLTADIISAYNKADKCSSLPINFLADFHSVKDRIFFKLVNYEKNRELLKSLPYIKWLDLAIIFCVLVKKGTDGIASFQIKKELLDCWEMDVTTVYEQAVINTPLLFQSNIRPLDDIIQDLAAAFINTNAGTEAADIIKELLPPFQNRENSVHAMYVASNTLGVNGAAWLLYKDELHKFSSSLGTDFYILPSSIHEVLLLPASKEISGNALLNMVREVNRTNVPAEDFLADNAYFYDRIKNQIQALF